MKKAILAPLCSAFVIPGLGQVINHDLKKGAAMLGGALVLLMVAAARFFQLLNTAFKANWADPSRQASLADHLKAQDLSLAWWVIGLFSLIWAYSVTDAFLKGIKRDRSTGDCK
jgi:hypothetical protein